MAFRKHLNPSFQFYLDDLVRIDLDLTLVAASGAHGESVAPEVPRIDGPLQAAPAGGAGRLLPARLTETPSGRIRHRADAVPLLGAAKLDIESLCGGTLLVRQGREALAGFLEGALDEEIDIVSARCGTPAMEAQPVINESLEHRLHERAADNTGHRQGRTDRHLNLSLSSFI